MALHVLDEANRCLGCKKPLCQQGCPIHTNIPEVIRLLKANQMDEAGRMLFENNPLTTVCALVCNHENQCELRVSSELWSSPRPISTRLLNGSLHLHIVPINLVVFKGSYLFKTMGHLIFGSASRLDAFSVYPIRT